jgi:hypothetical protein
MSLPQEFAPITAQLRVLRIIIASLILGVAFALACALTIAAPQAGDAGLVVELGAVAVLAGAAGARVVLPPLIDTVTRRQVRQQVASISLPADARSRETVTRLIPGYTARTIVAAAIAESAGFMGVVACFMRPSPIGIAVALAGMGLIATLWPTRAGIENWLEDQLRRIDLEA